jgi:hypothetical protein
MDALDIWNELSYLDGFLFFLKKNYKLALRIRVCSINFLTQPLTSMKEQ